MKPALGQLRELVYAVTKTAKVRKRLMAIAGVIIILQLYFVRELIAAELLFGLGFAVMLVLAGALYVVGAIGERGFDLTEAGARVVGRSLRRGYGKMAPVARAIGERGFELTEARARVAGRSLRRGYGKMAPVVRAIGERGFQLTEAGVRVVGRSLRRAYGNMTPVVQAFGERGFELTRARVGVILRSARRGFSKLEEVSKRQFRHPRSESVR
jgi:hypothetical protein